MSATAEKLQRATRTRRNSANVTKRPISTSETSTPSMAKKRRPSNASTAESADVGEANAPLGDTDTSVSAVPNDNDTAPSLSMLQLPEVDTRQRLQGLSQECNCPCCLEILVRATLLTPCGHTFCASCVASVAQCPTCRTFIAGRVRNRVADNVIAAVGKSTASADDNDRNNTSTEACTTGDGTDGVVPAASDAHSTLTELTFAADDLQRYHERVGEQEGCTELSTRKQRRKQRRRLLEAGRSAGDAICID